MSVLDYVRKAMEIEATAINTLLEQVGGKYEDAIELIRSATGKVVITGVGKSGHVGKKIAASLSSTGTPAFFCS